MIHTLPDRDAAEQLHHNLATKRVYDRKLHLGILPDEELVLMRSRQIEQSCMEAQLPLLDLNRHFPEGTETGGIPTVMDLTQLNVQINTPERPG